MKRCIPFIMAFLLIIVPNNPRAEMEGYDIVARSSKEDITLYAKQMNDLYYDFKLDFKGEVYSRPFWINVANNITYAPQIYYEDINKDKKQELIIILNQGYGTGVLQQKVYVYRYTNGLIDVLVDDPMAIIYKNVKTKLTTDKAEIKIGDNVYKVDITPLKIKPTNLFEDISFGGVIKYEVKDHQLIATISGQISPAGFVGQLVIVYEYRDKMYQAETIEFQPSPEL
ncbi:hypothetical protein SAMN05518871_103424 [Psychrobacillus sp. OK028]|uniref:hypothetical protein n=1 Tax=Psychrobacillus sp. OK028 TaxID=1884359 RepID=UPI00088AAEE8|nr:hypothetical protein [Psychrobacillus sp. OK028]SDN14572.1 hypothetical protein SAMN05518871_103424 [Psychrobacillus sp. OK028]